MKQDWFSWFWHVIYDHAMECADQNRPVLYSSRIDGALLPFEGYHAIDT